jgi:hypothetical protein
MAAGEHFVFIRELSFVHYQSQTYRDTDVHGLPLANSKPELRASSNPKYFLHIYCGFFDSYGSSDFDEKPGEVLTGSLTGWSSIGGRQILP